MDEVGHTETHAPQPLHSSRFKLGCATLPTSNLNVIAMGSHISPQVRQSTFCFAKQLSLIVAFAPHGCSVFGLNKGSGQASAH